MRINRKKIKELKINIRNLVFKNPTFLDVLNEIKINNSAIITTGTYAVFDGLGTHRKYNGIVIHFLKYKNLTVSYSRKSHSLLFNLYYGRSVISSVWNIFISVFRTTTIDLNRINAIDFLLDLKRHHNIREYL